MLKKINRLTNEILDLTDKLSMGYIMCRDEYSRLNRKLIDNFKVLHLKIQKLNKMKILYYKQKYKLKTIWD
jgi:hypothetical protein